MNRKLLLIGAAIAMSLSLAACSGVDETTTTKTAKAQEANQNALLTSTPIPKLNVSQERENLVKRATRINVQNMSSCITLFSQSGAVVAFFPVAGKVSSLNSYLLPGDRVVYARPSDIEATSSGWGSTVVEAPDIDGAYGENADGIFFFTADTDAYVEWKGDYFWSDACLSPATPTLLVQNVTE